MRVDVQESKLRVRFDNVIARADTLSNPFFGGTGILLVYQEMTGKMPVPPKLAEISQQTLETKYLAQRLATTDRRGERRSPLGD
jgi:hypothetical protein